MQPIESFNAHPDGTIRQLRPSDLPRFRDHLLRLDSGSRRDRFNGMISDEFVASYAERCFAEGTTVIGYVLGSQVLGAAELHERPEDVVPTGEIAFSVERQLQRKGIGRRLFERLLGNARGLGYTRLRVTTHSHNEAMKALARRFDALLAFEDSETVGVIELDPMVPGERGLPGRQARLASELNPARISFPRRTPLRASCARKAGTPPPARPLRAAAVRR